MWLVAVAAAVAGALVGGGVVWAIQRPRTADLNARAIAADVAKQAALQQVESALQQVEALKASQTSGSRPATPSAGATETTASKRPAKATTVTVKQLAFIKKVAQTSVRPVITADYATMLTGKAAAKAATAHGEESPPPNDYYIVNDNKLLRKLPVKAGIAVTVTNNDDGTSDPTGHTITFAKWAATYAAPDDTNASLREAPYWITIKNGVVTKIAEQYLP
jgi:Tfp pilus assembly protein PilX